LVERLLIVLYTGPTCKPCKTIKPMVNTFINVLASEVHSVEIDIEKDREIAGAVVVSQIHLCTEMSVHSHVAFE
jgi:thioredoxin-like negative regulator of GroEL